MDSSTIAKLNAINRAFYETTAREFDQTRGQAWVGWQKFLTYLPQSSLSVLDVGCGNGRFGVFLADNHSFPTRYHGLDNNQQLLDFAQEAVGSHEALDATFATYDMMTDALPDDTYNLVVLFGVLHHVAGYANRQTFMRELAQRVGDDGLLVFAAWRFYEQDRFRQRIVAWDDDIHVEKHDYLLDWRRGERALRYCHYVDDAEHTALIEATGMQVLADYRADGATGDMNRYSVLKQAR